MGYKTSWWSYPFDEQASKDLLFGEKGGMETQTIIDPDKHKVSTALSAYLEGEVGKGLPRYDEGPLSYEYNPTEEARYDEFVGMDPSAWFKENVSDPTFADWDETARPLIEEGFAGSLRGSGRYRSVEDSANKMTKDLATVGGQMIPEIYTKQLAAISQRKAERDSDYARDYQDWYKSLPQNNPNLDRALTYLGNPNGTDTLAWMDPGTEGIMGDLMAIVAQFAMAA